MVFSEALRAYVTAKATDVGGVRRFAEKNGLDRTHLEKFLGGRGLSLKNVDRLMEILGLDIGTPFDFPKPDRTPADETTSGSEETSFDLEDDGRPFVY